MNKITVITIKSEQTGHYTLEDGSVASFNDINLKKDESFPDGLIVLDGTPFNISEYSTMEVNGVDYNSPSTIYDAILAAYDA